MEVSTARPDRRSWAFLRARTILATAPPSLSRYICNITGEVAVLTPTTLPPVLRDQYYQRRPPRQRPPRLPQRQWPAAPKAPRLPQRQWPPRLPQRQWPGPH